MKYKMYYDVSLFSELDIYFFKEGTHSKLYNHFGSHIYTRDKEDGVYFALWAPNAKAVFVCGDFNNYSTSSHPLKLRDDDSGIWEGFICGVEVGITYKYHIESSNGSFDKADPYAFCSEVAPASASKICSLDHFEFKDKKWLKNRAKRNSHKAPISIYEVHLGSWRRVVEEENRFLTYKESALELAKYLKEMNFTHVELMPITEFPFEGSWGYQVTGYFAPTARYGTPEEFMEFVDIMHQNDIGVIIDWVPSHFVTDGHGLLNFDGTCLYEHQDPRQGYHPQWKSAIFNYDRNEVRAFLISSAMMWLEKYHIDGIRVDAVASMLYLNYAREDGKWIPNKDGGNINLGAVKFLKQLNETLYREFDDILIVAEESTDYPMVTGMVSNDGLGFGYKWNMGWMHDILKYMKEDPIYRQYHHHHLTFSFVYMYNENYILPLSHDEVVHMKGSLVNKMPGEYEQKFANLRALYALMMAHPGKKLLFMGGEFAQFSEWNFQQSLDWHLLENPLHAGMQQCYKRLNELYKTIPALYRGDVLKDGFEWIDENDNEANVIAFVRKGARNQKRVVVFCNFSGKEHKGYMFGVPRAGVYEEIFNSNHQEFGGNVSEFQTIKALKKEVHGRAYSISVDLPPLSVLYFIRS